MKTQSNSKYTVVFEFRNGRKFLKHANSVVVNFRDGNTLYEYLSLDGKPFASIEKGGMSYPLANGGQMYYNSSPLPSLYEALPDDWDKEDPALRIIDKILIINNSSGT